MATPPQTNATTSTAVDAEVSGFHSGEYTWKIEDAQTRLHLEAPREVKLYSPKFYVGSFTCQLSIQTRHKGSQWQVCTFISIQPEDSDNVAAFWGCKFDLLDAEGGLIRTMAFAAREWNKTQFWGFDKFVETDLVLNHGLDKKGKDLYLRAQIHVKGVPVQNGERTNAGTQLINMLADAINTKTSESHTEEASGTAAQCMLPVSASLDGAATGTLSFVGGGVLIKMPLVATGEDKAQALQQHMACYQILLENPCKRFKMTADLSFSDPSVGLHIGGSLVEQISLLHSLQEETVPEAVHPAKVAGKGRTTSRKSRTKRKSAEMLAAQSSEASMNHNGSSNSVPFKPPASVSGIACVLMLVEGAITPQKLLTCSCGPRLAVQTLWAASYLGHKPVEQVVTKWLQCVLLSMLAGDDVDASEAPENVIANLDLLKKSEPEWQQVLPRQKKLFFNSRVFGLLPSDIIKQIFTDLMPLLPVNISLHCNVLMLPISIVDKWMDSCKGAISLQSATVPDVACVLKLIDCLSHHPEVEVLHIPKTREKQSIEENVRVLEALDMVLPAMPKLRVLGLSNLSLTVKHMKQVVSILSFLRERLQGVALCLSQTVGKPTARVEPARDLFSALGKMAQLQTLRLEKWDEEITKEDVEGLKSLKVHLLELPSTSYVERMAVEVPGLKFCIAPRF